MEKITTYYIEMKSPSELKEIKNSRGLLIMECEFKQIEFSKFLNQLVGDNYKWFNWHRWSDEKWKAYIENDNLRTWVDPQQDIMKLKGRKTAIRRSLFWD